MPSEKEIQQVKLATLYELRLTITESQKGTYTQEELVQLLDQIAVAMK